MPAGEEQKLKDSFNRLPFSVSRKILESKNVKFYDITQESNETIFIPSKWYHQVENIDDAVSINHNWFNGCNLSYIAESLLAHHEEVVREIEDVKDMENFDEHCQVMLKSSFGMNFFDFLEILSHITEKRIKSLCDKSYFKVFDKFSFGKNHLIHDLKAIVNTLERMKQNNAVSKFDDLVLEIDEISKKIKLAI